MRVGPLVGSGDALYQPMYMKVDDAAFARFLKLRLSSAWQKEVDDMRQWMTRTE